MEEKTSIEIYREERARASRQNKPVLSTIDKLREQPGHKKTPTGINGEVYSSSTSSTTSMIRGSHKRGSL
jgi:hypothetical protein